MVGFKADFVSQVSPLLFRIRRRMDGRAIQQATEQTNNSTGSVLRGHLSDLGRWYLPSKFGILYQLTHLKYLEYDIIILLFQSVPAYLFVRVLYSHN